MKFSDLIAKLQKSKSPSVCASVYLLIEENFPIGFETIRKTLKLQKKTLEANLQYLINLEIIENNDGLLTIGDKNSGFVKKELIPISTGDDIKVKNYPGYIEAVKIIEHLNEASGFNYRPTIKNVQYIFKMLSRGFSMQQFLLVNSYFSYSWNNEQMRKNIRPITLYNEKFPDRVQEAENNLGIFQKHKKDLYQYMSHFSMLYKKHISSSRLYTFTKSDISSFIYWISSGNYSLADLMGITSYIFEEWGSDAKFSSKIVPSVILSDKLSTRFNDYKIWSENKKANFKFDAFRKKVILLIEYLLSGNIKNLPMDVDYASFIEWHGGVDLLSKKSPDAIVESIDDFLSDV